MVIKAQALVDFVAEFTEQPRLVPRVIEKTAETVPIQDGLSISDLDLPLWKLFIDRSSSSNGCGVGLV